MQNDLEYLKTSDFATIAMFLEKPQRILIATHTNPDGDAIGSALALYGYLKKKGHEVNVLIPDPYPAFLGWMPFIDAITVFSQDPARSAELIRRAQLTFCLDFSALSRMNQAGMMIRIAPALRILIDHHLKPAKDDFNFKISYEKTSSTSELVYDFIYALGDHELIDREIAECIYAGIFTDTGSFSYACNYVKTYLVTADLFRKGIDGEHLHRLVYDTFSESRLRLLGYAISQKLIVLPEYHTAYISLSLGELESFNYQVGDTEDIVNFGLSLQDVNMAALFYEKEADVKVSLRSKGNFSVDEIARKYFTGGGHRNAAGANYQDTLEETILLFLSILPEYKEKLSNVYPAGT